VWWCSRASSRTVTGTLLLTTAKEACKPPPALRELIRPNHVLLFGVLLLLFSQTRSDVSRPEVTWHLIPLDLLHFEDDLELFLFKSLSPVELFQLPTMPLYGGLSRHSEQLSFDLLLG
jgi:hypothetical protein